MKLVKKDAKHVIEGREPLVDGVRRDFEANLRVGAKARQERRHERRGR